MQASDVQGVIRRGVAGVQREHEVRLRIHRLNGRTGEVHIRADINTRFQAVGRVILAAQEAGVPKVGFLTEPRNDQP